MKPRRQRMIFVAVILIGVATATALALSAFRENMMYFYSPTEVADGKAPTGHSFRVGGLVKEGTVDRAEGDLTVRFVLTDTAAEVPVTYGGILPDLFREGQGIVATGTLNSKGVFRADEVMAKHDENYMPPDVADAIETAKGKGHPGQVSQ